MFNDATSEFDFLVASDAIGMGLNLNISRIIFSTMRKFDGFETRDLTVLEIKQIAADMDDEIPSQGLTQFAESYAKKGLVRLQEIFTPGTLSVPKTPSALKELESIHKVLDLYVWLSSRLEESFPDRELVSSQKAICSMLIENS